nr:valine--tRNA ligase [Desulfobacterales bacterium]
MDSDTLDKAYDPKKVEKRWYDYWEREHLFAANDYSNKKPFSIVIPPPNVTGVLHMGHAHNNTLQDILCRYRRMQGYNVLWMPGTDHAGIATQNVVENRLAEEGIDRHTLGREKFIERIWEWREKYGRAIIKQLKRLGASCDWDRERFTMDEGLSRAVRTVFVRLYNEGLIYRGDYIINWCTRCQTALSDLEVEHEEHEGNLYYVRYPIDNGSGALIVATTRPETMLGDTAVAVNPNDERYRHLKGKSVLLPLVNRVIPVIFDEYVDVDFGTGVLKVTPAHDPNDFEIGNRHKLASVKVIGEDGRMTEEAGVFKGMDRFECREAVIKALEKEGLIEKVEPYQHSIGHCHRCRTIVEPNLSRQWFVKVKPLAEKAIDAVKRGATRIIPETWNNVYFDWMYNIKDWCISRQIWWGHRIPAWTCKTCGELIVAVKDPAECPGCKGTDLEQEEDVLDTWFSSALWPFSTMGWPDDTQTLRTFYPTSVLITGFDILFFWVARMMMMGLHFMKEVPFRDVYIHALIRDSEGKKMSKSKGNVIDPLHIIDKFGTDALRFTLAAFAVQGRDIRLSENRIEGYRHFINKLWNAARFCLIHLREFKAEGTTKTDKKVLPLPDRWILSRLNRVVEKVISSLDEYKFNDAASTLYQFVWHEFCDWYIECVKIVLYEKEDKTKKQITLNVLWHILHDILCLLHPFIPFVTEEIWQRLPNTKGSIMKADFPVADQGRVDNEAESTMKILMGIINGIRNIRGEMNIPPGLVLKAVVYSEDRNILEIINRYKGIIIHIARLSSLELTSVEKYPEASATAISGSCTIFVPLKGIINFEEEIKRLSKELSKVNKELTGVGKKLVNEDFLKKAPPEIVEKVRGKQKMLVEKKNKLEANLERIQGLA